jgi:anti-anti-sigma factor
MTTTVIPPAPSATVILDGEIDIATGPAIRRSLMAAIRGGNVRLAVDMSGVAFIDAAGIGVLIDAAHRARKAGGGLSLLAPSWPVRRLLDLLPLDGILPTARAQVAPSLRAAPPNASRGYRKGQPVGVVLALAGHSGGRRVIRGRAARTTDGTGCRGDAGQ